MTLFVSDIHLGRAEASRERSIEEHLVACLRAHEDAVERLYLLGDVFDQYIEYRHLIPKGFIRFQALLAEWADRGVPITYLVGNHDPWHRDYFERELGVRVVFDELIEPLQNTLVYMTHGDGIASGNRVYKYLKPLLRHPVPVWLYTSLLPGDSGTRLARWVKHRFGNKEVDPSVVDELRSHARGVLQTTAATLVVMGHSHRAELTQWPDGQYLNPGYWHDQQTYGLLDEAGPHLLRWNGRGPVEVDPSTDL